MPGDPDTHDSVWPRALATGRSGDLLLANRNPCCEYLTGGDCTSGGHSGSLLAVNRTNAQYTDLTRCPTQLKGVGGVAVDSIGSAIVLTSSDDIGTGRLVSIDPSTGSTSIIWTDNDALRSFQNGGDVAIEADGNFILTNLWRGAVYRVNRLTGTTSDVHSAYIHENLPGSRFRVQVEADGKLLLCTYDQILRMNPQTGSYYSEQ